MSTITSILSTQTLSSSRPVINTNFDNLNTDKTQMSSVLAYGVVCHSSTGGNSLTPIASLGTSGQVLKSNGNGNFPTFQDETGGSSIVVETTTGVTHSLTTVAGQKVVVMVSGQHNFAGSTNETILLKYNNVTKHTMVIDIGSTFASQIIPYSLMYTETPGAATADITVTSDAGTESNVVIIVLKIIE